ncbi:hypothetical protein SAMN02745248_00846 [Hathewaya proteolytica DSM 3090]|uniref:Uncharacterized protein n=1 Tax=Hathewaya proteolytica DSM 3090 TaxID=1121331 RepID=A0A1M6LWD8_9CLOT|nr:hypothetical protein [Hathewaya proteolytica]SHJ75508.1 hypothetical protein SAMN02745248_00846 [Hathewaya proteolytica DSM 3090]
MKNIFKIFLIFMMLVSLMVPITVFAVGDGNIDSGGGGMGDGTSTDKWSPGYDGVRVTVVRASDHAVVTTPIDLTNKSPTNVRLHFGKVSKLSYNGGRAISPSGQSYTFVNPAQEMPRIVSTNGSSNIEAIKSYFTDEQVIRSIASITGMDFDVLIGGDYKLLLEPMAYYTFQGVMIATTATEAAMYDEQLSGLLRRKMVSLSHKNLPLAMFLEVGDLGYPAWSGSTTTPATNVDIKSSLGLGIVRFAEQPEPPIINAYDYEYRVNTEVITSVMISGGQSDPDRRTRVSFIIDGRTYNVGNVYYPSGDSQLAWVKWTTPDTEQDMVIDVIVNGPGSTTKSIINVKIIDLDKNPPPNPVADDRNDSFSYSSVPNRAEKTNANWSIWSPWWRAYWVWHSTGEDSGYWCDHGWWEFDLDQYTAKLSGDMSIKNDSKNPTASGSIFKSGYGINQTVAGNVSTNQSSAITYAQNAVSYFPEFCYETYWRLLERTSGGSNARFEFKKNNYSTYKNRTHFTPIWMPDGSYTVNTWLIDAWTPDGMLSMNLTDTLTIKGNLWQDWHIAPLNP